MAFFSKLKERLFKSSSKIDEGLDAIVEDGGVPWCIGLGSGDATGWPATDWMEDIMLRTQTPDVYDQWVTKGPVERETYPDKQV